MKQFLRRVLNLVTLWAKFEIVGGVVLVSLVLGYALFTNSRSDFSPSIPEQTQTTQQRLNL